MLSLDIIQGLMVNSALITAGATIMGAIVVFLLLFLILERYKKSLIAVFMVVLALFGGAYWYIGRSRAISPLDIPKPVVAEVVKVIPASEPVPLPKARPPARKKIAAKAPKPQPPICLTPSPVRQGLP